MKLLAWRVQGLIAAGLQHVRPHLLDGPAQLLAEQQLTEIDQLRHRQLGDGLEQIVGAGIGHLGMKQLARAQIALDLRIPDRRHGGVFQLGTEQSRRTQQRNRKKRLDLVHASMPCTRRHNPTMC
ncbi:hypothetical protein ACVIJ6_001010 [Bradyrhizobium sp. USDA 4369]